MQDIIEKIINKVDKKKVQSCCKKILKKCSFGSTRDLDNVTELATWLYIYGYYKEAIEVCEILKNVKFTGDYSIWWRVEYCYCLKARILREKGILEGRQELLEIINSHRNSELYDNLVEWYRTTLNENIQGEIERAIEGVTKEKVELYASGRTDAGVHAFGQVANFKTNSSIPINKMATAINSQLKYSIRIKNAEEVDIGFHSRYNCKEKTYAYVINNEEQASAIFRNMEYHFPKKLDVEKMKEAAIYFIGEHDLKPIINVLPDRNDIFKKLENLILNRAGIPLMAQNSRRFVIKHHDHIRVAQQYLDFWESH